MDWMNHEDYSLFASHIDLWDEKDCRALRQEVFRQRIKIEELYHQLNEAKAETTLVRHNRFYWEKLLWRLMNDFKAGKIGIDEFIEEFETISRGSCSFL